MSVLLPQAPLSDPTTSSWEDLSGCFRSAEGSEPVITSVLWCTTALVGAALPVPILNGAIAGAGLFMTYYSTFQNRQANFCRSEEINPENRTWKHLAAGLAMMTLGGISTTLAMQYSNQDHKFAASYFLFGALALSVQFTFTNHIFDARTIESQAPQESGPPIEEMV